MKFWSGQLTKVKLNIFETLRFTQVKEKRNGKKQNYLLVVQPYLSPWPYNLPI